MVLVRDLVSVNLHQVPVVLLQDQRPWKPRGQVMQGVYHPFPPEGARDRIGVAPLNAKGKHLRWRMAIRGRIADRTVIRSSDGPLHQRTVPEEADGPHGRIAASHERDKNVARSVDYRGQLRPPWREESQGNLWPPPWPGGQGQLVWMGRTEMEDPHPFLPTVPERKNSPGRPAHPLWLQQPQTPGRS
ncbi:unnamed protein product [Boreogadus saida]